MADKKVSQLPDVSALDDTDLIYVVDNGVSKKMTVSAFRTALLTGPAWIAPTLLSNWANLATYIPAGYRKVGDRVDIRFSLGSGNALPIFVLPAGYRPTAKHMMTIAVHDNTNAPDFGHIEIGDDGTVNLDHPASLNNHKIFGFLSFWIS